MSLDEGLVEECTCSICFELFDHPIQLPCQHSFCKACLQEYGTLASLCYGICLNQFEFRILTINHVRLGAVDALFICGQNNALFAFPFTQLNEAKLLI